MCDSLKKTGVMREEVPTPHPDKLGSRKTAPVQKRY